MTSVRKLRRRLRRWRLYRARVERIVQPVDRAASSGHVRALTAYYREADRRRDARNPPEEQ